MENFDIEKKDLLTGGGLQMDEQSASEWRQAAGWAKALAVLCIVGLCLFLLGVLVFSLFSGSSRYAGAGAEFAGMILGFLLVIGVGSVWVINLFRFSNNAPAAINNNDPVGFEKSVHALKAFFIISAIFGLLALLITLFGFAS